MTTILSEPNDEGFLFWVLHVKGNVGDIVLMSKFFNSLGHLNDCGENATECLK